MVKYKCMSYRYFQSMSRWLPWSMSVYQVPVKIRGSTGDVFWSFLKHTAFFCFRPQCVFAILTHSFLSLCMFKVYVLHVLYSHNTPDKKAYIRVHGSCTSASTKKLMRLVSSNCYIILFYFYGYIKWTNKPCNYWYNGTWLNLWRGTMPLSVEGILRFIYQQFKM